MQPPTETQPSLPANVWGHLHTDRVSACYACPRCRKAINPDKRSVFLPKLWLAYHPECWLSDAGLA